MHLEPLESEDSNSPVNCNLWLQAGFALQPLGLRLEAEAIKQSIHALSFAQAGTFVCPTRPLLSFDPVSPARDSCQSIA
jgi:hypothetical protein